MQKTRLLMLLLILTKIALAQDKKPAVTGIHHVGLSVVNLEKSIAFYTNTMQLKEISRSEIGKNTNAQTQRGLTNQARKIAVLQGTNCQFELMEFEENKGKSSPIMPIEGPGVTHVCFQAATSKSIYVKAKTFGASILSRGSSPIDRGYGITYAYARDASGIMFEMEHFTEVPFSQDVLVGHVAIVTPDIDRLVKFYTQLLGIEPHRRVDNIRNNPSLDAIANIDSLKIRGAWFKVGNMTLEMWQFENPKTKASKEPSPFSQIGYNLVAYEVTNLENTYQLLKEKGIRFLSAPAKNNNVSSAYARDPDGNLLMLVEVQ